MAVAVGPTPHEFSQVELKKMHLYHKVNVSSEVVNLSRMTNFSSDWFSNAAIVKAEDLFFRVKTRWTYCDACNSRCSCLYLEIRKSEEKNVHLEEKELDIHMVESNLTIRNGGTKWEDSLNWPSNVYIRTCKEYVSRKCVPKDITAGEVQIDVNLVLARTVFKSADAILNRSVSPEDERIRLKALLQEMLSGELFPDLTITLPDGTLSAHRAVLAASSAVFKAMLQHDLREKKEGEIRIEGVKAEIMGLLLKFLYGGEIPSDNPVLCSELLAVADRYQLLALKEACEDVLCSHSSSMDAFELVLFADTHGADRLKATMLQRIAANPKRRDLVDDDILKKIAESHPLVLTEILKAVL